MSLNGLLIYPNSAKRKNNAFDWFRDAAQRYGINLDIFFYHGIGDLPTRTLKEIRPDFVILRGYNIGLSLRCEALRIPVINSSLSMAISRDKYRCYEIFKEAGIPTPFTCMPERPDYFNLYTNLGHREFVMKTNFGSRGESVYLVHSRQEFQQFMAYYNKEQKRRLELIACGYSEYGESKEEVLYGSRPIFQEFYSESKGRDIRVWVIGDEIAGCTLRYNEMDFKSNIASGGKHKKVKLPDEAAELALKATRATGLYFAGIDILFAGDDCESARDFMVCEVNGNAGFRSAEAPTDIPDTLFRHLSKDLTQ